MKTVKIVLVSGDPGEVTVFGEVKALGLPDRPTVAHCQASLRSADAFRAEPGAYSFHYRIDPPGQVKLSTEIDGVPVGPPSGVVDGREISAGQRYWFVVPA
jgi:hypothetical protein